jgi:GT2 family glycosyltransferase
VSRPLVSVVTPTLNQAGFLQATLRSVRAQTYPNVEHIVIDGGSTDGTLDILHREGEQGTIRWTSAPDRGMYDAVNKGMSMAGGEVLAYLNSDDAYLPWAIQSVMQLFVARPGVDIVFGDGLKIEEETGIQRLRLFPPFDRVSLARYESLMQPAVFWRRRLVDRIGEFDTQLRYVADLDYWLRAAAAGAKIAHLSEVVAIERIHAGRMSSAQSDAMAVENREMRARHQATDGGPAGAAGRESAVERDFRWQRWLWWRFLAAWALRPLPGPWHQFLRHGKVTVKPRRALRGSRPHQSRRLKNAVVSRVAAELIAADVA